MQPKPVVTAAGVISAIGQGKAAFVNALLDGETAFGVMQRPGRQGESAYLGAEIGEIRFSTGIARQTLRAASLSAQAALVVLEEAWTEARLSDVDPRRIGLIVGGSNVQQRELTQVHEAYRDCLAFLRPANFPTRGFPRPCRIISCAIISLAFVPESTILPQNS